MKSLKKITAVLIALSMVLSLSVFSAEFTDVEKGSTHEKAIDVLSDIGIVKGYEDGTYKPDKEVTRAEITSLLMRMINLSITGIEVPTSYYTDVASNHWAVYDINTASDRGIIAGYGDGIFGPERSVTYEQAVKMIVCLLGYDSKATDEKNGYTGWPNGYMRVAREMGLLTNSEMAQTSPAPRKIIAQLLYNALEIQMADVDGKVTNDSILKTYLKVDKLYGQIVANSKTRLDNTESIVKDDEIQVEDSKGVVYKFNVGTKTNAVNMLGMDVVIYSKLDDTRTNSIILNIATQGAVQTVTVDAEDITSFNASRIVYEVDKASGRTSELAIASDAKIIYNDKYIDTAAFFNSSLDNIIIGDVTLTNSGSGYNMINVTSYTNYVVKTVDVANTSIYLDTTVSTTGEESISVPIHDTLNWKVTILKNNSEISLGTVKKGNIISVKKSDPTLQTAGIKIMEVLVSDSKVTGKITGTDEGIITIASKNYEIAKSLENVTSVTSKLEYDASGTFYLDVFGKIANVEFGAGDTYNHAYLIQADVADRAGEKYLVAKILDSKGAVKNISFADTFTIDGVSYTDPESAEYALIASAGEANLDKSITSDYAAANYNYSQPIKYTLNNSGLVNSVNTISLGNQPNDSFVRVSGTEVTGYAYNTSSRYFSKSGQSPLSVDSSTVVYLVPQDRYQTNDYDVKTISYFKSNTPYRIEAYETNSSGNASVVILYDLNLEADLTYDAPLFVYESRSTVNVDGVNKTKLSGYNFGTGAAASYTVENDAHISSLNLTRGDIIRFGKNKDGEINDKVYLYLDVSEVSAGTYANDTTYTTSSQANVGFKDLTSYPYRYIKTANITTDFYEPTSSIESDRTYYRTYTLAMPISVSFNESESTIMYTTDFAPANSGSYDVTAVPQVGFTVNSSTHMFIYDDSQPENSKLTYVKASDADQKQSYLYQLLTYDTTQTDYDSVYMYGSGESLRAIMIIK